MFNLTNIELAVLEVDVSYLNEETGDYESSESEYVVIDPRDERDYDHIIETLFPQLNPDNCKVCVYEARTADFNIQLYKSGLIEFDATGDIDTSTGYSGSPVYETTYTS